VLPHRDTLISQFEMRTGGNGQEHRLEVEA
jgi:hypothetical protein